MRKIIIGLMSALTMVFATQAFALQNTLSITHSTTSLGISKYTSNSTDTLNTIKTSTSSAGTLLGDHSTTTLNSNETQVTSQNLYGSGSISGSSDSIQISNGISTFGSTIGTETTSIGIKGGSINTVNNGVSQKVTTETSGLLGLGGTSTTTLNENWNSNTTKDISGGNLSSTTFTDTSFLY